MRVTTKVLLWAILLISGLPSSAYAGQCGPGVTAICRDGTTSSSKSRSGTCSRHGGVAVWCPAAPAPRQRAPKKPSYTPKQKPQKPPSRAKQSKTKRYPKGTELVGWVSSIHDGDTITLLRNKVEIKIRLSGIDAPELKQPFGARARQFVGNATHERRATVYVEDTDRYGRVVGWLFIGNQSINKDVVSNGYAWWYRQYAPKNRNLQQAELIARNAKRGLWADPHAVAPWIWRKRR